MGHFLVIVILFIYPLVIGADSVDLNSTITKTTWFWPILGICLALLLSVPCTLMAIVIICHNKHHLDDSDESSIDSSSSLSTHVHHRSARHPAHLQRSHYAGCFRSPPPPYTANEHPENVFISSSLPPPYDAHVTENSSAPTSTNPPTTINVESNTTAMSNALDVSLTLTNPSLQTFQI